MANLVVLDGAQNPIYIAATGAGTDNDPLVLQRGDAALLAETQGQAADVAALLSALQAQAIDIAALLSELQSQAVSITAGSAHVTLATRIAGETNIDSDTNSYLKTRRESNIAQKSRGVGSEAVSTALDSACDGSGSVHLAGLLISADAVTATTLYIRDEAAGGTSSPSIINLSAVNLNQPIYIDCHGTVLSNGLSMQVASGATVCVTAFWRPV